MKLHHGLIVLIGAGMFFITGAAVAQTTTGNGAGPTAVLYAENTKSSSVDISAGLKNQLAAAGYKKAEQITGANGKFMPPVYYFRVQSTSANPAWGDVGSVVSVFIYRTVDSAFLYNKGEAEVIDFEGRTQVRTANPGQYIVITGPDKEKTLLLAHNLKVLQ
jgi:hypothetical protein